MVHLGIELGILLLAAFVAGCLGGTIARSLSRKFTAGRTSGIGLARAVTSEPLTSTGIVDFDDRPDGLSGPRLGKADDLKRINGIGPRIEALLNNLGIYHFDQIAQWDERNVEWIDTNLSFYGRVTREAWIQQAADLASASIHRFDASDGAD